jgi:adenylate cyclase
MDNFLERIVGKKIEGTRVVPLLLKIVMLFTIFLLISNFASNYINLMLNRGEQVKLMNQLLVKELKEIYTFTTNQYDIYFYNQDLEGTVKTIEQVSSRGLKGEKSIALGLKPDGETFFQASKIERQSRFMDEDALDEMIASGEEGYAEGAFMFEFVGENYFGVYKYNPRWEIYIIRGEELNEFYEDSVRIFRNVAFLIVIITILCVLVGIFLLRFILRYVSVITSDIMAMQNDQVINLINMDRAPNDDVTYLGVAFNSLASTIDNLMNIFKKFVARDVAAKAYKEREIRLEGTKRNLAILFTDIKSFTFITETLGTDIIKLLNIHYDKAIRAVHEYNGDIGSIIGDALLAIYGAMEELSENKSYEALESANDIQKMAAELRHEMHTRREEILRVRGELTEDEKAIYQAVLLEVGVGIDGGEVFYGNIGSNERMVNTVIGDNVNSASRLEGLTRIYKVPIIVSEYIKDDVESEYDKYVFVELDQVQVKGKTIGKRVFWPVKRTDMTPQMEKDIKIFAEGLKEYYEGQWKSAYEKFAACTLPLAEVFQSRTKNSICPKDWNGIWTMKTK